MNSTRNHHISTNIMERIKVFESPSNSAPSSPKHLTGNLQANAMMMSPSVPQPPPPPGVQTDANGLILPKKLINPCLQSTDRKQLHRELKFNTKIGKSVLNQKTELQRAYEKQRERQQQHNHLQQDLSPTGGGEGGLKGELNRVIMERAQKYEQRLQEAAAAAAAANEEDDKQYVNPEYLNVRAKLRHGQGTELK